MAAKKKETAPGDGILVDVRDLSAGQEVKANDGKFYVVSKVDIVLDPRKNVYEENSTEALVFMMNGPETISELMEGRVVVKAQAA